MKPLVIIASNSFGQLSNRGINLLSEVADCKRIDPNKIEESEFRELIAKAQIIIGVPKKYSKIVTGTKTLKMIAIRAAGSDTVDIDEAKRNGIIVTYAPAANATSVAEMAVGLLLSLSRNIVFASNSVKARKWERIECVGTEIDGKTVGIIGLGEIGRKVGVILKAFNTKLLGYDPYIRKENLKDIEIDIVDLKTLISSSDIVTLHCPLTTNTRKMLNADVLNHVKRGMYIVNTSRGEVVDQQAIICAIEDGRISGYATDVLEVEPIEAGNILPDTKRVICTPHIGGYTYEAAERIDMLVANDIVEVINGGLPHPDHLLSGN